MTPRRDGGDCDHHSALLSDYWDDKARLSIIEELKTEEHAMSGSARVEATLREIGVRAVVPVRLAQYGDNLLISRSQASLEKRFDQRGYLTPFSDVAALMVFEHQMHAIDLLVRIGWDTRFALSQPDNATNRQLTQTLLRNNARELVDYLLFVDDAPLPGAITGSAFVAEFSARGPFDKKGRSLRQLDLSQRLMRYRCSYMIYSEGVRRAPARSESGDLRPAMGNSVGRGKGRRVRETQRRRPACRHGNPSRHEARSRGRTRPQRTATSTRRQTGD